jgi:hypothetical protein
MDDWTLTDWSEGTKGLDSLVRRARVPHIYWVGAAALSAVASAFLLLLTLQSKDPAPPAMFIAYGIWIVYLALSIWEFVPKIVDAGNQAGLRPDLPGSGDQFPVTVHYWRSGFPYGVDRGFAMIVDASLVFQGARSRFSFGNAAGLVVTFNWDSSQSWFLDYGFQGVPYRVSMSPGDRFLGFGPNLRIAFGDELERWRDRSRAESGEMTLPPNGPIGSLQSARVWLPWASELSRLLRWSC